MVHVNRIIVLLLFISSNLVAQNPVLVKDIAPFYGSIPSNFVVLGSNLLFAASGYSGSSSNRELYLSDGTALGTQLLKDIIAGPSSSSPDKLVVYNGKVYFVAADNTSGVLVYRPWVSDGTTVGTYSLFPLATTSYGFTLNVPSIYRAKDYFVEYKGEVYFLALKDVAPNDKAIFKTDGSVSGTQIAVELPNSTNIPNLMNGPVVFNDSLYFSGSSNGGANESLYKSDGTSLNTFLVKNDVLLFSFSGVETYDNKMYFSGTNYFNSHADEPWVTDGTANGTYELADLQPLNSFGSNPSSFRRVNNKLVFLASSNGSSVELFAVDSVVGSNVVTSIATVSNLSLAYNSDWLFDYGNNLYFRGSDAVNGYELWKSDGTALGTGIIKDIAPGSGGSNPHSFVAYCGEVYFTAQNPITGTAQALYKTNGTALGTVLLPGVVGNPNSGAGITAKGVFNNMLYFSGQYDVNIGEELYSYNAFCVTGINSPVDDIDLNVVVSPNPVHDLVTIEFDENTKATILVLDVLGQLVFASEVQNKMNVVLNLSQLTKGMYFVKLKTDLGNKSIKLIKD